MEKYNKQVSVDGAEFTVARINETNYANMYGVKDSTGRIIGTIEERLAGRDVGTYFTAWAAGYGKRDIRKAFTAYRKSWA